LGPDLPPPTHLEDRMKTRAKIVALRRLMAERGLAAYLVPSTDPHQSEYVPECWRRRAWASGFTGSAGDLLVTAREAGLWTDGRYFLQAESQLSGSGVKLYRMGEPGVPTLHAFVGKALKEGDLLGVDPATVSVAEARRLEAAAKVVRAEVRFAEENLVDAAWSDRPQPPGHPIVAHPRKFAGETVASKLKRVRAALAEQKAGALVIPVLDQVAWLYNIRGSDVMYNPVAIGYALVTTKEAFLFAGADTVSSEVEKMLAPGVRVRPYEAFADALRALAAEKIRTWVDEGAASRWIVDLLAGCELVTEASPILLPRARKNAVEVAGMKAAHVRDGVAMVRFLRWLEQEVPQGTVTELYAANKVDAFRADGQHFRGPSFDTISGYLGDGAIIHYQVTTQTDRALKPEGIYLIDSGGQYLDGTTDITRTVLLGKKATKDQKEQFTRVLRGHIGLARAAFPAGTRGPRLDTLARIPMWEAGLDYNHGTGHGVGAYLGVHEGPQSIGTRESNAVLEPGNILSNEPGYYESGSHGIRIENLILVTEDPVRTRPGKQWLRFETITLCPIDTRLVEPKLLSADEKRWLNDYHATVRKALGPHLDKEERRWLMQATVPVK
jgi:Xaa-Pro aminopeptidase